MKLLHSLTTNLFFTLHPCHPSHYPSVTLHTIPVTLHTIPLSPFTPSLYHPSHHPSITLHTILLSLFTPYTLLLTCTPSSANDDYCNCISLVLYSYCASMQMYIYSACFHFATGGCCRVGTREIEIMSKELRILMEVTKHGAPGTHCQRTAY